MDITIRVIGSNGANGAGAVGGVNGGNGGNGAKRGDGTGGRDDHPHHRLPPGLHDAVTAKLSHATRHLEGMDRADVRFTEERSPRPTANRVCEVTIRGHGHVVRATGTGPDLQTALDRAATKLEHGVDKLKGKLLGRSHPRRTRAADLHSAHLDEADEPEEPDGQPRIVRMKKFEMKPMTPEEAAMQMDLVGHAFYLFTSSETGQAGVVYRRNDGQIGLIDAD
jgi:putative sigma-54 modulation protein